MRALELDHVVIRYSDASRPEGFLLAASEVSLALERGDIGCLLGPSGCGKTSLLRAVAGFVPIAKGAIRINGELMADGEQHDHHADDLFHRVELAAVVQQVSEAESAQDRDIDLRRHQAAPRKGPTLFHAANHMG
ncbi:MAG: ATP-binding cassette domain-containing protein [Oxalobacteraceae bacterium]|nr:ATP-binding cassette domain-containing protein [Oxalobacteraceae bacterium]